MIRSANIATMPSRLGHLEKVLQSIHKQFDIIRIYGNKFLAPPIELIQKYPNVHWIHDGADLTDNGKFYGLDILTKPEYYFTLDDDIIYPPDYADVMVDNIGKYHAIVTIHGRILMGENLNYYKGHEFHHCTAENPDAFYLDVCGTGVTAFDTRYFKPEHLDQSEYKRMSDVVFSHAAAMQGRHIVCIEKPANWVKPLPVNDSIYSSEKNTKQEFQIKLCNEIWQRKRSTE